MPRDRNHSTTGTGRNARSPYRTPTAPARFGSKDSWRTKLPFFKNMFDFPAVVCPHG